MSSKNIKTGEIDVQARLRDNLKEVTEEIIAERASYKPPQEQAQCDSAFLENPSSVTIGLIFPQAREVPVKSASSKAIY